MAKRNNKGLLALAGLGLALGLGVTIALASGGKKTSASPPTIPAGRGYTVDGNCTVIVQDEATALKWAADLGTKALSLDDAFATAFPCAVEVSNKDGLVFLYKFFYALERSLLASGKMSVVDFQKRVADGRFNLQTNGVDLTGLPGAEANGFAVTPDCTVTISDEPLAIAWGEYMASTMTWEAATAQLFSGCNPNGFFSDPAVGPFMYRLLRAMLVVAVGKQGKTLEEANASLSSALQLLAGAGVDTAGLPGQLA